MELTAIYEANAKYVRDSGFSVTVDQRFHIVEITNNNDEDAQGFYLQGDEGSTYIDKSLRVWEEAGDLDLADAFTGQAKQYIDCL